MRKITPAQIGTFLLLFALILLVGIAAAWFGEVVTIQPMLQGLAA